MRFFVIVVILNVYLYSANDFITEFEYGQMLYHDPHGASCAACHGETGEGIVISEYIDKEGRVVSLSGPDIRKATFKQIKESVTKGKGVMPRYFLTDQEIKTISKYLQKVNKERKRNLLKLFDKK